MRYANILFICFCELSIQNARLILLMASLCIKYPCSWTLLFFTQIHFIRLLFIYVRSPYVSLIVELWMTSKYISSWTIIRATVISMLRYTLGSKNTLQRSSTIFSGQSFLSSNRTVLKKTEIVEKLTTSSVSV